MQLTNYHPDQENASQRFIRAHRAYIQKERRTGLKDSNNTEINKGDVVRLLPNGRLEVVTDKEAV